MARSRKRRYRAESVAQLGSYHLSAKDRTAYSVFGPSACARAIGRDTANGGQGSVVSKLYRSHYRVQGDYKRLGIGRGPSEQRARGRFRSGVSRFI